MPYSKQSLRHPVRGHANLLPIAIAFSVTSYGSILPSHIHDTDHARTARELKQELVTYSEKAPSMYQAMLTNLEKFSHEEDKVIADLAANRDTAFGTLLPNQNRDALVTLRSDT